MQDKGVSKLKRTWQAIMRGEKGSAIMALRENYEQHKTWALQAKFEQEMQDKGVLKLKRTWQAIMRGEKGAAVESMRQNYEIHKAELLQAKFEQEMQDKGVSKLKRQWALIMRGEKGAMIESMRQNWEEHKTEMLQSRFEEEMQLKGVARLKRTWAGMMRGVRGTAMETMKQNYADAKAYELQAQFEAQMQEKGIIKLRKMWLKMLRGSKAVLLENIRLNYADHKHYEMQARLEEKLSQAKSDAGLKQLKEIGLRLMRGAKGVAVNNLKENYTQFRTWELQAKIENDMQDMGVAKLRRTWKGIIRGAKGSAIEGMRQNWSNEKASALQMKFEQEMQDAGVLKLRRTMRALLKGTLAATFGNMRDNWVYWETQIKRRRLEEDLARQLHALEQTKSDAGLRQLKNIWQAMMKGKPAVLISNWRYNVFDYRVHTLHAHIALQVAETSLEHAVTRCKMMFVRMVRGEVATRLQIWKNRWHLECTEVAKLAAGAQTVKQVLQELMRGNTVRAFSQWRVNVVEDDAVKTKQNAERGERAQEEERHRQVEAEKMDRLRERQVAQAIVERTQDEMEHAKARASEMEKRGKAAAEQASQRALEDQLRAEKDKSDRLEKRLKSLESRLERGNSPSKQQDRKEVDDLKIQLDRKEQERRSLEKQVQELMALQDNNRPPADSLVSEKPRTPNPKKAPKKEAKPDAELTREERMMRAAERRANNSGYKY